MAHISNNIMVGKPSAKPTTPSHVPGIRQGNELGSLQRQKGVHAHATGAHTTGAHSSARRSTGINARDEDPIDPRSPNLTPA